VRESPDGATEAVLVLRTLAAPERRRLRGRRPRPVESAEPEPVPTARATVVRPEPFASREEANSWLASLRRDDRAVEAELDSALRVLNRSRAARRAAAGDPYAGDVSASHALACRLGYGSGEAVAEGRFADAIELPLAGAARLRRSMQAPDERFAALLGGREEPLLAEELVLRARADLNAGREREAALEARIALEALVAQLGERAPLDQRERIRAAANAALEGRAPAEVEEAVAAMEAAIRRRRHGR
jgi:glucose/arabinose dehydrogenase